MSNWERLFGAPTKAAHTILEKDLIYNLLNECESCPVYEQCRETIATQPCRMDDEDAILKWLNND